MLGSCNFFDGSQVNYLRAVCAVKIHALEGGKDGRGGLREVYREIEKKNFGRVEVDQQSPSFSPQAPVTLMDSLSQLRLAWKSRVKGSFQPPPDKLLRL